MDAALAIRNRMLQGLLLAVAAFGLAACGGDNDDLDQYINQVKARPGGRIEPLPEITPYEVFTYVADAEGVRSPFVPDTPQAATAGFTVYAALNGATLSIVLLAYTQQTVATAFFVTALTFDAGAGGGIRPIADRSREFLEGFPLDTLRMVGTLNIGETTYGLVQTSDGLIHRVVPGNYMGQNDGRINEISESEIALVEIISDGIGGYIERDAAISLSD